jgi:hypothetical protein
MNCISVAGRTHTIESFKIVIIIQHCDKNHVDFLLKRAPQIVDLGAICFQKCIILGQSYWSQAGCLNTANFSHLPGRIGLRLSFLIDSCLLKYLLQ